MFAFLQIRVRKEISAGVLIAGLILACIMWFLSIVQAKADAFNQYVNTPIEATH